MNQERPNDPVFPSIGPEENDRIDFAERLENAGVKPYHLLLGVYGVMIIVVLLFRIIL